MKSGETGKINFVIECDVKLTTSNGVSNKKKLSEKLNFFVEIQSQQQIG